MNATEALALARAAGVSVSADGDDLVLDAPAPPPPTVLELLSRHKADIMTLLRPPAPTPWSDLISPPLSLSQPYAEDWDQADADHASIVAGLLVSARRRPPSWADPSALPSRGCFCTCCKGQRWWREREAPKGWRCSVCYPPDHLPSIAVTEMTT
ncbi:MAG: hypothetical protein ABSC06_36830 [Rhodopila sp.]|jgi:hypothetical protein